MKQTGFSPRLYVEGLRQLRLLGILLTVAVSLVAVFLPVSEYMATLDYDGVSTVAVNCLNMNPLIILSFCIVAPFLTLNLFSFLNRRESSDFYHALPVTRTCLFFSFFAAVVTWIVIFIGTTTLLSTLCHAIFPQLYIINYRSILYTCFNCFAGSLLVSASVAIAMSATGTVTANLLVALMIIFMPRALLSLILSAIESSFPLVSDTGFLPILSVQYNVPVSTVFVAFTSGDQSPLTSWQSGVYTLVLAVLYTAIACLLFRRRHSEGATHSAPNRYLQGLYRFLIGFTVSAFVTLSIWSNVFSGYTLDAYDVTNWVFFYVIALFASLAFELFSTRRVQGFLRKAVTTLLWLAVANGVLFGILVGARALLVSYSPAAADITSVRILSANDDSYVYGDGIRDYFLQKSSDVQLEDSQIAAMVSKRLKESVTLAQHSEREYYNACQKNSTLLVSIKSHGISHVRRIVIYDEDMALLSDRLAQNNSYQEVYMNLPDTISSVSDSLTVSFNLDKQQQEQLYTVLQNEVKSIGFEKWYALLNARMDSGNEEQPLTVLQFFVPGYSEWSEFYVPLYPSMLPKTTNTYLQLYNEHCAVDYEKRLSDVISDPTSYDAIEVHLYNIDTDSETVCYWDGNEIYKNSDVLRAWLEQLSTSKSPDSSKPLCYLQFEKLIPYENDTYGAYYDYAYYDGFFVLSDTATELPTISDSNG